MITKEEEKNIMHRYTSIRGFLYNEQQRRIFAATEARIIGYGGISILSRLTGIDREAISRGLKEIEEFENSDISRVRNVGGGSNGSRPKLWKVDGVIYFKILSRLTQSN